MYKNGPTLWNFTIKIIFLLDSILIIMIGSQNFTLTSSSDPMFSFSLLSIRQQWMFLWRLKNLVWYVHFIMIWISNIQTGKHGKRKFYFSRDPMQGRGRSNSLWYTCHICNRRVNIKNRWHWHLFCLDSKPWNVFQYFRNIILSKETIALHIVFNSRKLL